MSSHARDVITDLFTVLRADLGDYDLSTANGLDRVVLGTIADIDAPPSVPWLYLGVPQNIDDIYGEAPLREYDESAVIPYIGFCQSDSLTPAERALDGLDFAEEIRAAIMTGHQTAARTTLYSLLALTVSTDDVMSDAVDLPTTHVVVAGRIRYRRVTVGGP